MKLVVTILAVVLLVLVGLAALLYSPPDSSAQVVQGAAESQFFQRINDLRAQDGVKPLRNDPRLVAIARTWSITMANTGQFIHNPAFRSDIPFAWSAAGENIGKGGDYNAIETAFEASPEHVANMLNPRFDVVGIGAATAEDGTLYVTEDFAEEAVVIPTTTAVPTTLPPTTTTVPVTTTIVPAPATTLPGAAAPIPVAPAFTG